MARKKDAVAVMAVMDDPATEISITIPLGDPPLPGFEAKQARAGQVNLANRALHLQAQLGPDAATAFIRIRNGLRARNAKLEGGRPVWSNVDALRWLMEQVAAEVA